MKTSIYFCQMNDMQHTERQSTLSEWSDEVRSLLYSAHYMETYNGVLRAGSASGIDIVTWGASSISSAARFILKDNIQGGRVSSYQVLQGCMIGLGEPFGSDISSGMKSYRANPLCFLMKVECIIWKLCWLLVRMSVNTIRTNRTNNSQCAQHRSSLSISTNTWRGWYSPLWFSLHLYPYVHIGYFSFKTYSL